MKTVQLTAGIDDLTRKPYWTADPLGERRRLPRTYHESATLVGDWKVDLKTGVARLLRQSVLDCL